MFVVCSNVVDPVDPSIKGSNMHEVQFLRRRDAANYLKRKYGFGAARTLAKLAVIGGGPAFYKAGAIVLYQPQALDAWAIAKIGAVRVSTSDSGESAQ
jgi:hypothetical protein